jgi:hypothetical protein
LSERDCTRVVLVAYGVCFIIIMNRGIVLWYTKNIYPSYSLFLQVPSILHIILLLISLELFSIHDVTCVDAWVPIIPTNKESCLLKPFGVVSINYRRNRPPQWNMSHSMKRIASSSEGSSSGSSSTFKLNGQFQAGDMNDIDIDNNIEEEEVNERHSMTNSTIATKIYASISSISNNYHTHNNDDIHNNIVKPTEACTNCFRIHQQWLNITVCDLQQVYYKDSISILHDDDLDDIEENDDDTSVIRINSIIFSISFDINNNSSKNIDLLNTNDNNYIVVLIDSTRRVNTTTLQSVINTELQKEPLNTIDQSINHLRVQLTPRDDVELVCGYPPGSVPPILGRIGEARMKMKIIDDDNTNTMKRQTTPLLTIVDESLLPSSRLYTSIDGDDDDIIFIGGGGQPNYSCRITLTDVFVQQPSTITANVANIKTIPNKLSLSDTQLERNNGYTCNNNFRNNVIPDTINQLPMDQVDRTRSGPAPYFAVGGPSDRYEVESLLSKLIDIDNVSSSPSRVTKNVPITLQDGWDAVWEHQQEPQILESNEIVTFVGRIGKVRRMARELSFCDLLPPDIDINNINGDGGFYDDSMDLIYPWRNPITDTKMAVQLICGKTLCQNTGSNNAIRQLHGGQLLLVNGRTNLQSKNSLRNWIYNQTLDIVVLSYVLLLPVPVTDTQQVVRSSSDRRRVASSRKISNNDSNNVNIDECLRLKDLYHSSSTEVDDAALFSTKLDIGIVNGETGVNGDKRDTIVSPNVVLVDDFDSVKRFTRDLSQLLQSYNVAKKTGTTEDQLSTVSSSVGLVGIDCEWKPTFFLESSRDPQPVLVLQVSLHPLQRVYIFDLQTLLRPMMPQSQPMDKLEREVAFALEALFESKRLIKVGFHVVNDLRQLAASYPHVPALQFYNAVIEASTLGKKAIRHTQLGNAREATSSLTRLVTHYIGKPLNKMEQCSDWSKRPLTSDQIEYAALDAAVTPIMVEKMISDLKVYIFMDKPYLGRWESDMSFKTMIVSLRFVFVQTTDSNVQRKLKAKQIMGEPLIVSQSWITGDVPPKLPAIPETNSDGAYTDVHGVVQIPSVSVTIRSNFIGDDIDSMIGNRVGTSKDMCVANFLHRPISFPDGARLEYPQRSGFVEFKDGVILFVNMQSATGNRYKSKSYPNEWLQDGKILTWFLRENDWQQGQTSLAKKLLADPNSVVVTLFVRMGKAGDFICCGRCRVQDTEEINGYRSQSDRPDSWTLIKLNLILLDWKKLQLSINFQSLLNPGTDLNSETDDSVFD